MEVRPKSGGRREGWGEIELRLPAGLTVNEVAQAVLDWYIDLQQQMVSWAGCPCDCCSTRRASYAEDLTFGNGAESGN